MVLLLRYTLCYLHFLSESEPQDICGRPQGGFLKQKFERGVYMLSQAIHRQNAVLGLALQGTSARNDAIMNNIANADVPGFTARRVEFEGRLAQAVDRWQSTGVLDFVDLSRARPVTRYQEGMHFFRMDRSNVDMEREMVALFTNSVRYDVLVNSVMHNSRMLGTVLQR